MGIVNRYSYNTNVEEKTYNNIILISGIKRYEEDIVGIT